MKTKAYLAGFKAGTTHDGIDGNPYAPDSDKGMDWDEGWLAGDAGGEAALMREATAADGRVREEEGDE